MENGVALMEIKTQNPEHENAANNANAITVSYGILHFCSFADATHAFVSFISLVFVFNDPSFQCSALYWYEQPTYW